MSTNFAQAQKRLQELGYNLDVTRSAISASGASGRSTVSGWRALSWSDSTIQMSIIEKPAANRFLPPGPYGEVDALGQTDDTITEYDIITTSDSRYFQILGVNKNTVGASLANYDCYMKKLPILQDKTRPATTANWKTSPNDPRSRTKTWIDTYVRNASILKDDGSTQATWACIFANPPYPLSLEYRAVTNPVQGLYVVEHPNTTALYSAETQTPYGYEEEVPIGIYTVDSTDCSGHQLLWRMEAELRYVFETYSTGSLRTLSGRKSNLIHLGNMQLYNVDCVLTYRRDKST